MKVSNAIAYTQGATNITFSNAHGKESNGKVPTHGLINMCLVRDTGVAGSVSSF